MSIIHRAIMLHLFLAMDLISAEPKVLGLGFGRTGTDSMKQAFIELGLGLSYDMIEANPNPKCPNPDWVGPSYHMVE